jgi:endonuclease III
MSQAFGEAALGVDTHVHRLSLRWGLSKDVSIRVKDKARVTIRVRVRVRVRVRDLTFISIDLKTRT